MTEIDIDDCDKSDNYDSVNKDILFIMDRIKIVKKKISNTSLYLFWKHIKLRKELNEIREGIDIIGERIEKLDNIRRSREGPIRMVRRK